ncbi:hypothetical protein BB561_001484 [Smittium simulii]|uniref:Non-structural maintenance of chromosomes element 1 homolog n=1 Tax=Smittium simulii TaxID=133385 RepID=A0A2T9YUD6_9FUNG|nr:hypothetical protein BB561_001484 [Smittium simulii]
MSDLELKELITKIYDSVESDTTTVIQKIRKTIEVYGLDLVKKLDQITGTGYWCLVNTKVDTLASLSTGYSLNELTFMKLLLEGILTSENNVFSLTYHEALGKVAEVNVSTFKKKEGQLALDAFVKDGWLELDSGRFSLGIRTLAELQDYLRDIYSQELNADQNCIKCLNCDKEYESSDSTIGNIKL